MEPVSLVVGLAGLFSTCIDVIEAAQQYRHFKNDSEDLDTQLNANKALFERWGRAVGILEQDEHSRDHHAAILASPRDAEAVARLLKIIRRLFEGQEKEQTGGSRLAGQTGTTSDPRKTSRWNKVAWMVGGRAQRVKQVTLFGEVVKQLYDLIPIEKQVSAPDAHDLKELNAAVERLEIESRADTIRCIHKWLTGVAHSSVDVYEDARRKRIDKTCDWIISRDEYGGWVSPVFPDALPKILWMHGPAGFGKTVICSHIVTHASSILTPASAIAYFFFSAHNGSQDDPHIAIRSWVSQLIAQSDDALQLARNEFAVNFDQVATRATVNRLLHLIVEHMPGLTLITDGLDECSTGAEDFIADVKDMLRLSPSRLLVVSRDTITIRQGMTTGNKGVNLTEMEITVNDTQADTSLYAQRIVEKQLSNKPKDLQVDLAEALAHKSCGQFLWITLQSQGMRKGMNKKQLQRAIDDTPPGIETIYARDWERILALPTSERLRILSMLRWMAFAFRPLTVAELTEASLVSLEEDGLPLDTDELPDEIDQAYIESEILGFCGSLLEVVTMSATPGPDSYVYLRHFSAKEFLMLALAEDSQRDTKPPRTRDVAVPCADQSILARLCLRYISSDEVWDNESVDDGNVNFSNAFRGYASRHWARHYELGGKDLENRRLVKRLLCDDSLAQHAWTTWYTLLIFGPGFRKKEGHMPGPLFFASFLGLTDLARELLEEGHDVNEPNCFGWTATKAASCVGDVDTLRVLLKAGARLDIVDEYGYTDIHEASRRGKTEAVKILIEAGADLTQQTPGGLTALHLASQYGCLEMVRLLLECGADVNADTKREATPLYIAIQEGQVVVAKHLLQNGAHIHAVDADGYSLLHGAALHGQLELARLLLELAPGLKDARTADGHTPLHLSSRQGCPNVSKLLLVNGAGVDAQDDRSWQPLHEAVFALRIDTVALLLEAGADVNARIMPEGCQPLHLATEKNSLAIVQLLVEAGANMSSKDGQGYTALDIDIDQGEGEIARYLRSRECCTRDV